jgi:hypothetical protein
VRLQRLGKLKMLLLFRLDFLDQLYGPNILYF